MFINMKEAYLKVLGLNQKALEEKVEEKPEASAEVELCEKCGKVHEGACKESMVEKEVEEEVAVSEEETTLEEGDRKLDLRSDEKKVGGEIVRDKKKPPFDGPYSNKKVATPGKSGYGPSAAKHLAKQGMKAHEDLEIEQFAASLAENGFDQSEIDAILSRLEEKAHVGTGGPAPAEPQEMGDNLSDGELDFVDSHEIEVVDMTPEKPDFDKDVDQATAPTTKGVGTAEVDGQKVVKDKPEVAVKSQATAPKTK
jgi:hypothetical protein